MQQRGSDVTQVFHKGMHKHAHLNHGFATCQTLQSKDSAAIPGAFFVFVVVTKLEDFDGAAARHGRPRKCGQI